MTKITVDRALIEQALKTLEFVWTECDALVSLRKALRQPQAGSVYLVATGVVHDGHETYTRHEGSPPPLCEFETLYSALAEPAVEPVAYRYKYLNFMGDEVWSQDMPRNGKVLETQELFASPPPPAEPAPVPLLSDAELEAIEVREKPANGPQSTLNFARAIEQAVRRKAGL